MVTVMFQEFFFLVLKRTLYNGYFSSFSQCNDFRLKCFLNNVYFFSWLKARHTRIFIFMEQRRSERQSSQQVVNYIFHTRVTHDVFRIPLYLISIYQIMLISSTGIYQSGEVYMVQTSEFAFFHLKLMTLCVTSMTPLLA